MKQGTPRKSMFMLSLAALFGARFSGMGNMNNRTTNQKTLMKKAERLRYGIGKHIGNSQRKRRKLLRQVPQLSRSKKYSR